MPSIPRFLLGEKIRRHRSEMVDEQPRFIALEETLVDGQPAQLAARFYRATIDPLSRYLLLSLRGEEFEPYEIAEYEEIRGDGRNIGTLYLYPLRPARGKGIRCRS